MRWLVCHELVHKVHQVIFRRSLVRGHVASKYRYFKLFLGQSDNYSSVVYSENFLHLKLRLEEQHYTSTRLRISAHAYIFGVYFGSKHYQGTDQQRNALQLIITAYDRLGLTDLRDDVIRVMQANFPNADPHAYQPPEPSPWDSLLFWREDKGAAAGF